MKTHLSSAAMAASLVVAGLMTTPVMAQGAAPRQTRPEHGIRVIDVSRVLQEHERFNAQIEQFRGTVREFEQELRGRQEALVKKQQEMQQLNPGSPERRTIERDIEEERGRIESAQRLKQKEFLEREAKIIYFTYKEIQDEVNHYCQVKNVSLVLSYSSEQPNPEDRMSVMRAMSNPVIAENGVDITDVIIKVLNRNPAGGGQAQQPNVPRPR